MFQIALRAILKGMRRRSRRNPDIDLDTTKIDLTTLKGYSTAISLARQKGIRDRDDQVNALTFVLQKDSVLTKKAILEALDEFKRTPAMRRKGRQPTEERMVEETLAAPEESETDQAFREALREFAEDMEIDPEYIGAMEGATGISDREAASRGIGRYDAATIIRAASLSRKFTDIDIDMINAAIAAGERAFEPS
jgi:hypothetical protein